MARPMPRLPPVTRAVRPSIGRSCAGTRPPRRLWVPAVHGRSSPVVRRATPPLRCGRSSAVTHSPSAPHLRDTSGCSGDDATAGPSATQHDPEGPRGVGPRTTVRYPSGTGTEGAPMPAGRRTHRAAGLAPAAAAPARLRVGVIGAGRVGAVLGAALAAAGHEVVAAAGLSSASAERAARLLPGAPLLHADQVVAAADLVVLAVPDDTLAGLVAGLAETGAWRRGQLAFHTSGAHGLAVLAPAQLAGVLPLALHPAMTFTGAPEDVDRLVGAPFGVTSRPEHRAVAETLVLEMGGEPFYVAEADRRLYHAALVTGANHLVTLVAEAS